MIKRFQITMQPYDRMPNSTHAPAVRLDVLVTDERIEITVPADVETHGVDAGYTRTLRIEQNLDGIKIHAYGSGDEEPISILLQTEGGQAVYAG